MLLPPRYYHRSNQRYCLHRLSARSPKALCSFSQKTREEHFRTTDVWSASLTLLKIGLTLPPSGFMYWALFTLRAPSLEQEMFVQIMRSVHRQLVIGGLLIQILPSYLFSSSSTEVL
jgi:hypothetical protein